MLEYALVIFPIPALELIVARPGAAEHLPAT
jgi:hypothetical protein